MPNLDNLVSVSDQEFLPKPVATSDLNSKVPIVENVVAVITHADGSQTVRRGGNIVTDAGNVWYAQKACAESPTNAFANIVLGSTATPAIDHADNYSHITPIGSTSKAKSSGYPKTNDDDANNTDKDTDVVSWKFVYAANDFTAAEVTEGIITISGATGTNPILCHWEFVAHFAITATDALTVFVNHTMLGA